MQWAIVAGIAALVCGIVFVCRQTGNRQPADANAGKETPALSGSQPADANASGKETPAPSGIDALEVVKAAPVPYPFRFATYHLPGNKKASVIVTLRTEGNQLFTMTVPGDISQTNFKIDSFERKEVTGADGYREDVSELTVLNKESGEKGVLRLHQESYAIFHYKWVQPGGQPIPDFTIRLDRTFTLPPKRDTTYRVIAIEPQEVVIEVPDLTRKTLAVPK